MEKIIPYSDMKHGHTLRKQWVLCDFMSGYLYWYDNRSQREHGPVQGRERVRRVLDEIFTPDIVLITVNDNSSILDSVGASNFEYVKREGRLRELIYVRSDGNRIPIHNWSDVLRGNGYRFTSDPYASGQWIEILTGLVELDDLLRTLGIPWEGTWGSLAVGALRATVRERYRFASPGFSARGYRAGRIEEKTALATISDAVRWDIVGAYAWAMSHRPMPVAFAEDDRPNDGLLGEGIALAEVKPKEIDLSIAYSPVPTGYRRNLRTNWGIDPVVAFFPFPDLRSARDDGALVRILRSWTAVEYVSREDTERLAITFMGLRTHYLGKKIANSLWGAMIGRGEKIVGRYLSDSNKRKTRKVRGRSKKRGRFLTSSYATGSHVSGLVREKIFREALSSHPVVLCHTDGVVIHDRSREFRRMGVRSSPTPFRPNGRVGPRLGDWKFDGRCRNLRIASAQHYVYVDASGQRQFVWAGDNPPVSDPDGAIRKLRASERISTYEALRAATRNRPENWYDRWVCDTGEGEAI